MTYPLPSSAGQPSPTPSHTTPSYEPVGIFWDYENCPPSTDASGYNIVNNIRVLANRFGAVNTFKAYLQLSDKSPPRQSSLRSELRFCGLSVTECPHNGKNSVDSMMTVDIMAFIKDNSPPTTVVLISSGRDFTYLLSTIRWRNYNIVLISNSFMTHESPVVQASAVYDWQSDILGVRPPPKLPLLRSHGNAASPVTFPPLALPPSDDRIVANSTNGSTAEHPPIRQVVAVDPGIQLNQPSFKTLDPIKEDGARSPAFISPGMIPSEGGGDVPFSPEYLLLSGEEGSNEPSIHGLGDMDSPGAIKPVLQAHKCKTCVRSPILLAPKTLVQDIVVGRQVGHASREPSAPPPSGAVPPTELPPTREVPSSILAPAFALKAPHPPSAEVAKYSAKTDAGHNFGDSIGVLDDLSANGNSKLRLLTVSPLLKDRKSDVFDEDAGTTKPKEHVQVAVEAGVVTARVTENDNGQVEPSPAYHHPPVHSSASTSTVTTPQTCTADTASPFTPLVDFLKSEQLESAQPVPFSDILDHFVSTLGYPDLLYLYTSVPGVKTFSQYIDAAIASGLVSLVSGTTASRDALVSLRDAKPPPSVGLHLPVPMNPTTPQRGPFEPLISNLTKLWLEGKQEPMLSEIEPLVWAQDAVAHESIIKDYVTKAAAANIVIYDPLAVSGRSFMATTIRLREPPQLPRDPPPLRPNASTTPLLSPPLPQEIAVSPPSVNITQNSSQDPVAVLTKLWAVPPDSELINPGEEAEGEGNIDEIPPITPPLPLVVTEPSIPLTRASPADPELVPTISGRSVSPNEEASLPAHDLKWPQAAPTSSLQSGASETPPPIPTVRTPTPAARAEDLKRQELLHKLLSVKPRYDDLQKSFRECRTALKEIIESLLSVSQNDTANLVRIFVQRLDDFNEDTRVELEIRGADEERVTEAFQTLLRAKGAIISEEEMADLEEKVTAFVQGTDKSVSRTMQQFSQKLDDLTHDIASIKTFIRGLPNNIPGPAGSSNTQHTPNPNLLGQRPPSWPVSPPAITFRPTMVTPKFQYTPSLPHLHKSPPELSDPLAGLHLRIPMPTPMSIPSSPLIARPPSQRQRTVSVVHMLGFGDRGGLLNSSDASRRASLTQTPVSDKMAGATDSDTSEDVE